LLAEVGAVLQLKYFQFVWAGKRFRNMFIATYAEHWINDTDE